MIFLLKGFAYSLLFTGAIAILSNLFVGRCELVSYYKAINSEINIRKLSHFEGYIGITVGLMLLVLTNLSNNIRVLMILPIIILVLAYLPLRNKYLSR